MLLTLCVGSASILLCADQLRSAGALLNGVEFAVYLEWCRAQGVLYFDTLSGSVCQGSRQMKPGLLWELNPGPLAPKARIIPLDQAASCRCEDLCWRRRCSEHAVVCERSRRSMYTSIATQMPGFALSMVFVASGLSSELTFHNVERDRASNHVGNTCGHNTVHSWCVMCVCANPPRQLRSACHTTPAPLCTDDVRIARATSLLLMSSFTHFMPRWHSGMGRHVCVAWKKTCQVRAALQRSLRCASITSSARSCAV